MRKSHLTGPAPVSPHVGAGFYHVVPMPARDGHEGDSLRVVTDLLDIGLHLLADLLIAHTTVGWLCDVHLVDGHDELLHAQHVGQQGVLKDLPVHGDASLELIYTAYHNQHSTVHLARGDTERKAQFWFGLGLPLPTPIAGRGLLMVLARYL